MNNCTFLGRLGQNPETRTVNDTSVCNFSLAVNRYVKNGEDETIWIRCALWGKRGQALANNVKKGDQLCVTGQISMREYQTQAGEERVSLELFVKDYSFVASGQSQRAQSAPDNIKPANENDDDLPY